MPVHCLGLLELQIHAEHTGLTFSDLQGTLAGGHLKSSL